MWREGSKESRVKAGREMSGRQPRVEVLVVLRLSDSGLQFPRFPTALKEWPEDAVETAAQ